MSLVATGGGLLFGGDVNGRFRAFDQRDGQVLWEVSLGSAVTGYPVTYAVNGKQYVAISSGLSGPARSKLAQTPELKELKNAAMLYVFGL